MAGILTPNRSACTRRIAVPVAADQPNPVPGGLLGPYPLNRRADTCFRVFLKKLSYLGVFSEDFGKNTKNVGFVPKKGPKTDRFSEKIAFSGIYSKFF